jgi:cytoskeletal protein RodZ
LSDTSELQTASPEAGPGRTLERLRTERKLSVADVAQRLKYGARQIEALEAEEFDRLPGATFVRGMVRGYAKLLEIDPEPILALLEQRYVPGEVSLDLRAKRVPFPQGGKRRGNHLYLFLSLVVFVVMAGVLYEWRVGAFPWASHLASNATQAQPQPPHRRSRRSRSRSRRLLRQRRNRRPSRAPRRRLRPSRRPPLSPRPPERKARFAWSSRASPGSRSRTGTGRC